MPIDVVSTTNQVEGNESDIERAPFVDFDGINLWSEEITRRAAPRIPYLSRLVQRTTRQWSVCVVETCIAQKSCKGLCSKEVDVLHNSNQDT